MDTPSGKAKFNKFNRLALESKLEGVMIKDPDGYYETKRTWAWIKKKPKFTVSLPVVGFQLGKPDGQFHDCLGNLECAGVDDSFDPRFVEANVGGGFTPEERVHLWKYRHKLKGMIAEIETDGITTNEKGKHSLRFPQFKNFRGKKT
jgi:DNA ligase-1